MNEEIKVGRTSQPVQRPEGDYVAEPTERSSKAPWVILVLVVIILAVFGILFRDKLFGKKGGGATAMTDKPSGYQAVFLSNGQVYFGKLSEINSDYVTLKDIYYLQVTQPPLQGPAEGKNAEQQPPQPQISLVKLGNELHGPVDEMKINRQHVLFFEDLKENGRVVEAIKAYKANPQGTPAPTK